MLIQNLKVYCQFIIELFSIGFNLEKAWLFFKTRRHTMVTPKRLNNVYELVDKIEKMGKKGVVVECGVWKGGCVAIMAYVLKKYNSNRKIWAFDSFEGLPEPTPSDGRKAKSYATGSNTGKLVSINDCVASIEDVKEVFKKLDLSQKNLVIKKGWFQETLPQAKKAIGKITLLRLDGDWYQSTKVCLDSFYNKVISGGYIILDDYHHWEGCRKAVDEFMKENKIDIKLQEIDGEGVYFQKTL